MLYNLSLTFTTWTMICLYMSFFMSSINFGKFSSTNAYFFLSALAPLLLNLYLHYARSLCIVPQVTGASFVFISNIFFFMFSNLENFYWAIFRVIDAFFYSIQFTTKFIQGIFISDFVFFSLISIGCFLLFIFID